MNPLANMFQRRTMGNQANNPLTMIQQFNQFRNSFRGDPRQMVMNLMTSGQMSQDQFNQLSQMAKAFQNNFRG